MTKEKWSYLFFGIVLFLLLFNHRVKTADCVALKTCHRTTTVQNKYEFSNVIFVCVFHNKNLSFI